MLVALTTESASKIHPSHPPEKPSVAPGAPVISPLLIPPSPKLSVPASTSTVPSSGLLERGLLDLSLAELGLLASGPLGLLLSWALLRNTNRLVVPLPADLTNRP